MLLCTSKNTKNTNQVVEAARAKERGVNGFGRIRCCHYHYAPSASTASAATTAEAAGVTRCDFLVVTTLANNPTVATVSAAVAGGVDGGVVVSEERILGRLSTGRSVHQLQEQRC